jgi:hypothetical protein
MRTSRLRSTHLETSPSQRKEILDLVDLLSASLLFSYTSTALLAHASFSDNIPFDD